MMSVSVLPRLRPGDFFRFRRLDAGQVGPLPPDQVTLARDPIPAGLPWFVAGYYKTKIDFQKTEGGWIQTFKLPTAEISCSVYTVRTVGT